MKKEEESKGLIEMINVQWYHSTSKSDRFRHSEWTAHLEQSTRWGTSCGFKTRPISGYLIPNVIKHEPIIVYHSFWSLISLAHQDGNWPERHPHQFPFSIWMFLYWSTLPSRTHPTLVCKIKHLWSLPNVQISTKTHAYRNLP